MESHSLIGLSEVHEWQEWRDSELWTMEVNDTLEANSEALIS